MNKREYLLRFHRFQKSREKFFAPKIAKALQAQYQTVIDNAHARGGLALDLISHDHIEKVIRNIYMDAGIIWGAKVRSDLNKISRMKVNPSNSMGLNILIAPISVDLKARMPMGFSERMASLIAQYFKTDILNTSIGITETTKDLIKQVFTDAYSQGLGIDDIIAQLKNTELSRIRARLIARTETVTASNKGAMFVAKDTGLTLNKEWLSARDKRVRFHHREENGKIIGMDELFTVGSDLMLHPGDRGGHGRPKVSANNLCNCRCSILFIPLDDMPQPKPVTLTPPKPVFTPAKTLKEAEEYAKKIIGVKYANFKGIDLAIANDINKSVFKIKEVMPEIRTNGIGSAQQANKEAKARIVAAVLQSERYKEVVAKFGKAVADRQATRMANRHVANVGSNTIAWSQTKREVVVFGERVDLSDLNGVFVNEKFAKSKATMDAMVKKNQEKKWFTESAEDFGYIMSHEIGHEIDKTIKFERLPEFVTIFNREHSLGIQSVIDKLSTYGATAGGKASAKRVEMIAEAWAEFVTSKNPRELAKEIGELMLKTYHTDYVQGTGTTFINWRTEIMKIVQQ